MAQPDTAPRTSYGERQRRIRLLAMAELSELSDLYASCDCPPAQDLRKPETGLVMVRGRMGGTGRPFNLGEATLTRGSVQLESGEIGYGHRLGEDVEAVRLSACLDALAEHDPGTPALVAFLERLTERETEADRQTRSETEATRVNFFTMVRGDN